MNISIQYPIDYPDNVKTKSADVVTMFEKKHWNELYNTVICQDREGNIVARFGDDRWDVSPYKRKLTDLSAFDFTTIPSSTLRLELKLIVYGWLFHKSTKTNQASKVSSLISRLAGMKSTYIFLSSINASSLTALSDNKTWTAFENFLIEKKLRKSSLEKAFVGINHALSLQSWLRINFNIEKIKTRILSSKINNKEMQQTLVIPERIGSAIFGQAIILIEQAYPYKEQLLRADSELQANYLEGKKTLEEKVKLGGNAWSMDVGGNIIDKHKYAQEISEHLPQKPKKIIIDALSKIKNLAHIEDANAFRRYYSQLINACYIVCGAFSGMRNSELSMLTPDSYYCERFDNRDYHMLQSHTFKLGEKRETWVTAPITKKAITLATTLTEQWRKILKQSDTSYRNTLWLNHSHRSKPPVVIDNMNVRLQRFCRQFDIIINEDDYQDSLTSNPLSKDKISQFIKVGEPWHLTSHQFRRTLAFYTIKHRLGTTLSLKQQFKHIYLSMTEWYTNGGKLARLQTLKVDSELQKMLDSMSNENTTDKIFNMVHSNQKLSGSHGKSIVEMRDDLPHIYSSWDVIYAAVKSKRLTLHGTAHSYCKSGYECDMDGIVNPSFCVDCSSNSSIIDEDNARWWQKKHTLLTKYLVTEQDISHSEYSHLITQVRAAEIVMKDFGMQFIKYKNPIEIIEL